MPGPPPREEEQIPEVPQRWSSPTGGQERRFLLPSQLTAAQAMRCHGNGEGWEMEQKKSFLGLNIVSPGLKMPPWHGEASNSHSSYQRLCEPAWPLVHSEESSSTRGTNTMWRNSLCSEQKVGWSRLYFPKTVATSLIVYILLQGSTDCSLQTTYLFL